MLQLTENEVLVLLRSRFQVCRTTGKIYPYAVNDMSLDAKGAELNVAQFKEEADAAAFAAVKVNITMRAMKEAAKKAAQGGADAASPASGAPAAPAAAPSLPPADAKALVGGGEANGAPQTSAEGEWEDRPYDGPKIIEEPTQVK